MTARDATVVIVLASLLCVTALLMTRTVPLEQAGPLLGVFPFVLGWIAKSPLSEGGA